MILSKLLEDLHYINDYTRSTTPRCPKCNDFLDQENLCINPDCYYYNVPAVIIDVEDAGLVTRGA